MHELVSKILLGEHAGKVMLQDLHTLPEFQAKKRGRPKLSYQRYRNKGPHRDNEFRDEFRYQIGRFVDGGGPTAAYKWRNSCINANRSSAFKFPITNPLATGTATRIMADSPLRSTSWLPLTPVFGTNSLWTETERGLRDWHPFTAPGPGALHEILGLAVRTFY